MNKVQLIDKPECPFCWRIRMAAALQGREVEHLDREDPEVLALWERLSPTRTVPVLIDGDLVITESGPMLEYLAETGPALLPDDPAARAEARGLVCYADNPIGRTIREVIFEKRGKPEAEWDQDRIAKGTEGFLATLPALEARLEGRDYLVGDQPTLAECALFPRFALAAAYGVPIPDRFPRLQNWYRNLVGRQKVLETAPAALQERVAA